MQKINEYCSFASEEKNWDFLNKIITYENRLFPITDDSIKNLNQLNISENENISVINDMQSKIDEEISESLLIYVITWNLHGKFPELNEISKILPKKTKENSSENNYQKSRSFDLFVINTQECLRSIGASFFNSSKEDWENALKIYFGDEYINLVNSNLNSFHIAVFVKKEKINFFTELKTGFIKTGFMNILGNKGAIGVSMKYQDKKMLFICCHLSSGQDKSYARNNDFKKISSELNLKPTTKFNNNLNNIKLGLRNGIYQSYFQDEDGEKNNFNLNSNLFKEYSEVKNFSNNKNLMIKKIRRPMSPSKSSIIHDLNFNQNENTDSILNSNNRKIQKNNVDSNPKLIHKKNTHNFNHFSKISNDNYSNSKNIISPKVDFLLLKGDSNTNTNANTKNKSSNIDEQILKIKRENFEELESSIGVNQYDLVIFSGDLNYRINMEIEDCKRLLEIKDIESLLEKDQLYTSIRTKEIELDDFYEGQIQFPPTYKFQDGTSEYDYNERVPGWTDRILYRANNLSDVILCKYSAIFDAKTSDHKPVYAIFKINFDSHDKNKEKYANIEKGCLVF
jgi:hypothetical protein